MKGRNFLRVRSALTTKRISMTLLAIIALIYAIPLNMVSAANPAAGSLASTDTTPKTWAGALISGTTNGESSCVEGVNCDTYTLTLTGTPSDWAGKQAHVEINWTTVATDYDMYIHKGTLAGPEVGHSASGTTTTEVVNIDPASAGTGVFVVHVLAFTGSPADPYNGAASVAGGTTTGILPAVQSNEIAPRFQNFTPQPSILPKGTDAGEPSIGVNWLTGNILFTSDLTTFKVAFDDSCPTTPSSVWTDVSPATSADSLDPIMFTDHGYNYAAPEANAGRTIVSQLSGTTSLSSFTDNDGGMWTPNTGGSLMSGVDHQTVGSGGPFHAPLPVNPVYPHPVYYCSQSIAEANCALSLNGGLTYGPAVPIYTLTDCGGLHGHVKVGPDGTTYVPNTSCNANQGVAVSEDNGTTWTVRRVPNTTPSGSDPSVAIGRGDKTRGVGRLYFGFANGNNDTAGVAVSDDNGRTWKNTYDVGASMGIKNVTFPAMIAGDDDRAAFTFMGSTTAGDGSDRAFPGLYHLYAATTYDGGLTWKTVDVTPNDPVQRNGIWLGGGSPAHRNLLDFTGADIDKTGRMLVGYADGCTSGNCVQDVNTATGNSFTALSSIARQTGGKSLFAAFDAQATLTGIPGAPLVTVYRNGVKTVLSISQSDNGGSPITGYTIYRGTTSGGETLLANVNGAPLTYQDFTAAASTAYYYKVVARNALGNSCGNNEAIAKPTGDSTLGMTVVTDPAGDQKAAPANDDLDIQSVKLAGLNNSGKLVFKMKITNPTLQVNRQWRIIWNYPIKAADIPAASFTGTYYVGMNTDGSGVKSFEYGTVTTVETVPANTSTPNRFGDADLASSFDASTGTINIVLDPVKIGSPTVGDILGKIVGRTFAGNGNQTVLSTSAIDATAIAGTIDPYTADAYQVAPYLAPTAASVSVSGRTLTANGRGVKNVSVTMTDAQGNVRTARTGSFGYFIFDNVSAGETYVFSAKGKRYNFGGQTRVITVNDAIDDLYFVEQPASGNTRQAETPKQAETTRQAKTSPNPRR